MEKSYLFEGETAKKMAAELRGTYTDFTGETRKVTNIIAAVTTEDDPTAIVGIIEGSFSVQEMMMAMTVLQKDFMLAIMNMHPSIDEMKAMSLLTDSTMMSMDLLTQYLLDTGAL